MATVAETLEMAADKLEPEGAWTQGAFARNEAGHIVTADSPRACSFCGVGAVYSLGVGSYMADRCSDLLDSLVRTENFAIWNDQKGRKQSAVVAKLRAAAAKARQS